MNYLAGYIKLNRSLLDWEWYKNLIVKSVFIHCLLSANWEDKKWQGITIKRGSFITSREKFAEDVGLSCQQVRTAWKNLETTGEIAKKSTNRFTLIVVNNWDKFQLVLEDVNQQITNNQPTTNQQLTNN